MCSNAIFHKVSWFGDLLPLHNQEEFPQNHGLLIPSKTFENAWPYDLKARLVISLFPAEPLHNETSNTLDLGDFPHNSQK